MKIVWLERKKNLLYGYFSVHKEDKSKAMCKYHEVGAIERILIQLTFKNTCRVIVKSIRVFVRTKLYIKRDKTQEPAAATSALQTSAHAGKSKAKCSRRISR